MRISDWSSDVGLFRSRIPELKDVAEDFDRMVRTLREGAEAIRRTAEENAHSFKTPIGIIMQSLEPLKRALPHDDRRARRSLEIIEKRSEEQTSEIQSLMRNSSAVFGLKKKKHEN